MRLHKIYLTLYVIKNILLIEFFALILVTATAIMPTYPHSLNLANNQYYYNVYAIVEQPVKNETKDLSLDNLIQQGSPNLGNALTASVTIIDFSDFQCYPCARFVKTTEPIIKEEYIDTEKVVLVFKHLPNRGFDSMEASIAAQCANEQKKFWDFHKLLFENQKPIDSGWVNKENLKKFATKIHGLNMDKFNDCLDSPKSKSLVEKDIELGSSFGFEDTPSFVIVDSKDGSNPVILEGAHPFPSFKAIIDRKLSEMKNESRNEA
jgi:protein-disulfide isomerase